MHVLLSNRDRMEVGWRTDDDEFWVDVIHYSASVALGCDDRIRCLSSELDREVMIVQSPPVRLSNHVDANYTESTMYIPLRLFDIQLNTTSDFEKGNQLDRQ
jgi:hypothetical protein